jgi:SAM-dependent methyltransferase
MPTGSGSGIVPVVDDPAASQHYNAGVERDRLLPDGEPRLELARTLELFERYLPPAPADVLDVGGGPGVYASRLARDGYRVNLIDLLPLHVEQAAALSAAQPEAPFATALGDARKLEANDESADAVLLLGPLYHLTAREHRLQTLCEARRVLRVGGVVIGAAISRFASLLDGLSEGMLVDPTFRAIVERDLRDGQHRNPAPVEHPEWFTTSYFHRPAELAQEVTKAGFALEALLGVEGPGWLFEEGWNNPAEHDQAVWAARLVEQVPDLLAASAHLLVVGRKR